MLMTRSYLVLLIIIAFVLKYTVSGKKNGDLNMSK